MYIAKDTEMHCIECNDMYCKFERCMKCSYFTFSSFYSSGRTAFDVFVSPPGRLTSLDLVSLKSVKYGSVVMTHNEYLCYWYTINWNKIAPKRFIVQNNMEKEECGEFMHGSGQLSSHVIIPTSYPLFSIFIPNVINTDI